ncbi:MAG: helix-turn-helix domain-containing protein [Aestuariivirgaceae bacterium]
MSYKYIESGLDNVYLKNGYTIHKTPYGEGITIQDTDGLHQAIGMWLITQSTAITDASLRFLRIGLDMTQKNLAAILNTTEQTLRLWEKHRKKPIQGSADRLLRVLYSEYTTGKSSVRKLVKQLAEFDQRESLTGCIIKSSRGWEIYDQATRKFAKATA